jgi:hypothetical protein
MNWQWFLCLWGNNASEVQINIPEHPGKQGVGPLKNQPQTEAID